MPQSNRDIIYLIKRLSTQETVLEMLMEFEKTMDNAGVFAYKNWEYGELVDGPYVDRYWFTTTWMYPQKLMPDPDGGLRLLKYDCKVQFGKDVYHEVQRVLSPADTVQDADEPRKAKEKKVPVWLVTISMPRRFVDDSHEGVFEISGEEVDVEDIHAAYEDETQEDMGFDDDPADVGMDQEDEI